VTADEIVAEGSRLAAAAERADLRLRLLGGVAIALRCPSARHEPLARSYGDIDLVGRGADRKKLGRFLVAEGYRSLEQLNAVHGGHRLFYYDPVRGRKLDVFIDRFDMCHELDLRRRLDIPGETLPLADLLLTKVQVVQTTEKDLKDIVSVLTDHELSDDESGVNASYLAKLTAGDWGLWRTTSTVLERRRARRAAARAFRAGAQVREMDDAGEGRRARALVQAARGTRLRLMHARVAR
jgi:hypothetical protein